MSNLPIWERRFRAPILSFPSWAADAPDRMVLASTESGSYQLHAWDRATGERRQVTRDHVGVLEGRPTRDGTGVIWFRDETGAETGTFVVAPFDGDAAPEPLLEGLPKGWSEGLAIGRHRSLAAVSTEERLHRLGLGRRGPGAAAARARRSRCGSRAAGVSPGRWTAARCPRTTAWSSSRSWRTATCSIRRSVPSTR